MEMQKVTSSHITHIGHEADQLHVTYKGGKTYVYPGCNAEQFAGLQAAKSIGTHLPTMGLKSSHILEVETTTQQNFESLLTRPANNVTPTAPAETAPQQVAAEPEVFLAPVVVTEETLEQETLSLYEQSTALVIFDEPSYIAAAEVGKNLKALEKKIIDFFEDLRIPAKAAYDAVLAKKNTELAPVVEAMGVVRKTLNDYVQAQDRIRKEEARKAQLKADDDAKKEREKLVVQAEKAIEQGKDEKAESLLEKMDNVYSAPVTIAPTVAKTVVTSAGNITQAKELKVTVTNMVAFIRALCDQNPGALPNIVKIGDGPLKAFIKSNGLEKYPGLQIEQTVGVRL